MANRQPVQWAYGVTTVRLRRDDLLPRTLQSLKAGGFNRPHLFVDGCPDIAWLDFVQIQGVAGVTFHHPRVRTAGNWVLALAELYFRDPLADRYMLVQDDVTVVYNLRAYLEECPFPEQGYWNAYTVGQAQVSIPRDDEGKWVTGWHEARCMQGGAVYHGKHQQFGKGALLLVFNREGVIKLLTNRHLFDRATDSNRGYRNIDGGVVETMNQMGWREYVHHPSLCQHISTRTTIQRPEMGQVYWTSPTFPGEQFDALTLKEVRSL